MWNQKHIYMSLRQFNVIVQRSYVAKIQQSRQSAPVKQTSSATKQWDIPIEESINASFLMRNIGSTYQKWSSVLDTHPKLKTVNRLDVINTANALKKLNLNVETILAKPLILYQNALTIENRYKVLDECGFQTITVVLLLKYITVINKTVNILKSYGYIPFDMNVLERLCNCLELSAADFKQCDDRMDLKYLRECIINTYLRQRLDMNDSDIKKLWQVYYRIRHRSFKSVHSMLHLLIEDLQFPKERIIKNAYLLHGDPENVRRIIAEIPSIDDQDIREIIYRRPKILMSSCDGLLKILEFFKAYGIPESAIMRCLEILTLSPDTVLERLKDLNAIEEFQVLATNPRILRLVHYQNKARVRLEYLNQLKVRCASLHILSGGSEKFEKFAREGSDRTKGSDVIIYLANIFKKEENVIRANLARHANWYHIPVVQVKQCFDFLRAKKFPCDAIYKSLHLLLYPIERVEEKLLQLQTPEFIGKFDLPVNNIFDLDNERLLTLILYFIECEFHFTGDGIWTEQHIQPVENFTNLLPDFPESLNKRYRYRIKSHVIPTTEAK